jgi:hypothetical protein
MTNCKKHKGELHPETLYPVDKQGNYILYGYRTCGLKECVNPEHHTLNIRKGRTLTGKHPEPLFKKKPTITGEQLHQIAKPLFRHTEPQTCQVPRCSNKHRAANLCGSHHSIWLKWRKANNIQGRVRQNFKDVIKYVQPPNKHLTTKDRYCHYPSCEKTYFGRGLCQLHLNRYYRATGATW